MKRLLTCAVLLMLVTLAGCKATAQKYTTHTVKEGESLESIATQYKVTPANILKFNREIQEGQTLRPNTILVIPSRTGTETTVYGNENPRRNGEAESQEEVRPVGFESHRVKRQETLYGIAQQYGVTEDEIKKYNRQLYADQLQRKMVLRIPKYDRPRTTEIDPDDYETYTVAPKETRWSIAYKYGITIDSLLALNPGLSETSDYLRAGQELKLPRLPGSTVENQETELYISYTVPAKMNFYRLEEKFGVKSDEIMRLNPEILEQNSLKEGMVIRIPQRKLEAGEINTDNYVFYEVKPKQTLFSLTRKLGLTYDDLVNLNPDLREGLKSGMILKLPKEESGNLEVRNSLVLDKIDLLDSINPGNRPRLMIMLPFRLDRLNLGDREEVADRIATRNDLKYSLGLYSGALVALDSIADLGVSVDVAVFDNELDLAKTKEILSRQDLSEINAIVGPLDAPSLKETAVRAGTYDVPVIAPIPVSSEISLNNVFFSYTSVEVLRRHMLDYMKDQVDGQHVVVIADKNNATVKDSIVSLFPEATIVPVIEEEENISIDIVAFTEQLSPEQDNWVFVETDNAKLVSSVSSILNSLNTEDIRVRMFTTNKNRAFENDVISSTHLSNLKFTFPSVYKEAGNDGFARRYRNRFGTSPDRYAVRGFDITYDLLLKLAYKNDLLEVSKLIGKTEYSGNTFDYEREMAAGYYNQASYIMSYDNMRIVSVKEGI